MKLVDVLICGGGPAGLAAAIAVRRKGFDVVVADGLRPPIDKACGEGLMPDALEALGALGVSIPAEHSWPFQGIRFVGSGKQVEASFPRGAGLGVRRTTLHTLLIEQAARCGVKLLWGTTAEQAERNFRSRWMVGADGARSSIRRRAGLDGARRVERRFAFRRHYRIAPWSRFMEIWWGPGCQIYLTPISGDSVCVALISRDARLRLDDALPHFPELMRRLRDCEAISVERGAVSMTRRLRATATERVALVGDASGSVDAITGEGLCLAFRQALELADALERGSLAGYQREHRRMMRRPAFMADFMLLLDRLPLLRGRALGAFAARPELFAGMLAMHVGELGAMQFARTTAALGWGMLAG